MRLTTPSKTTIRRYCRVVTYHDVTDRLRTDENHVQSINIRVFAHILMIFNAKSTRTYTTTYTRINMAEAFNARRVKYCGAPQYDIVAASRRSKYDPRHNVRRSRRGENASIVTLAVRNKHPYGLIEFPQFQHYVVICTGMIT